MQKKKTSTMKNVIRYCVEGNLQAVLDEYVFVLGLEGEALKESMSNAFIDTSSIRIETREDMLNNTGKTRNLRNHFAVGYYNSKSTDKNAVRTENLRSSFNSPFRPFVLATTSIGQEGLDFHRYSRKIMHWNLPSNPIDLEQREGRINRYLCHAIRQGVAHSDLSNLEYKNDVWKELFTEATNELKKNHSDLVPFWFFTR